MTIRLIRAAANNEITLVFNYLRAGDNVIGSGYNYLNDDFSADF